jgi:hypothetical protein
VIPDGWMAIIKIADLFKIKMDAFAASILKYD